MCSFQNVVVCFLSLSLLVCAIIDERLSFGFRGFVYLFDHYHYMHLFVSVCLSVYALGGHSILLRCFRMLFFRYT